MTLSNLSTYPSKTLPAVIPLPKPDITPVVTVWRNSPNAVPMATTNWPTFKLEDSPSSTGFNPVASILSMAISFAGSREIWVTSYSFSSLVITLYLASSPEETTCLLVTISPSWETIKPVPMSCGVPPSTLEENPPKGLSCKTLLAGVSTETVTTEGDASSATLMTTDSSETIFLSITLLPGKTLSRRLNPKILSATAPPVAAKRITIKKESPIRIFPVFIFREALTLYRAAHPGGLPHRLQFRHPAQAPFR